MRNLVLGIVLLVIGLGGSIATYAMASGGGTYIVAYGAVILGAIKLIQGIVEIVGSRATASAPAAAPSGPRSRRGLWVVLGLVVVAAVGAGGFSYYRNSSGYLAEQLASSPDRKVRSAALRALSERNEPKAIEGLIAALSDAEVDIRRSAAYALGEMKATAAVEPLMAAFPKEQDHDTANYLVSALGRIGDPRPAAMLAEAAENAQERDTRYAGALSSLGESAMPALTAGLSSQNPYFRAMAAEAVVGLAYRNEVYGEDHAPYVAPALPGFVEPLGALLHDEDEGTVKSAAAALVHIGSERARALLVEALAGQREATRKAVATAIGQRTKGWNPVLLDALRSEDPQVRANAAYGLGEMALASVATKEDQKAAVDALSLALADNDLVAGSGAYRYFIKAARGDALDYLVRVLIVHGDEEMATQFLNCGNETLNAAAKAWAATHGYEVTDAAERVGSPVSWGKTSSY